MGRGDLVTFDVKLLAGVTHMRPEKPGRVERPFGMAGWTLNRSVSGAGVIRGGPKDELATPGDILLFPPAVPHLYCFDPKAGGWVHQWVYFFPRERWLPWMSWDSFPPGVLRLRVAEDDWTRLGRVFDDLIAVSRAPSPMRIELSMNRLEELLILCELANPGRRGEALDERLSRAIAMMERKLSFKHGIESLAKEASLSKSRFSHLFQERLGLSPMAHLEKLRVKRAKELLSVSSASLDEIAAECGFLNAFYFSRVFKKAVGLPPGEFRRQASMRKPLRTDV